MIVSYLILAFTMCDTYSEFAKYFMTYFFGGLVIVWTFTEYFYHRFLFHKEGEVDPEGKADPDFLEQIFASHLHHHVFMNQWNLIGIRLDTIVTIVIPTQIMLHFILPTPGTLIVIAAWVLGGLIYDGVHLSYHFNVDLNGILPGFQRMKDQHMRHHFRDNTKEFGVTTDLWDIVYGTTKPATKIS